jgi:peptidoglycan/LPS O-acetylase OafA/YrhL
MNPSNSLTTHTKSKETNIEVLRGIAALMVVFYHYTSKNYLGTIHEPWLYNLCQFGFYGVHIFFVISGLVLPLSLQHSKYKLGLFGNFIARRAIRIMPPSWIAMGLIIAVYWGVYLLTGRYVSGAEPLKYSITPLIFNITYTVPFFDTIWYNAVYWTLTVEFTFYLAVGLLFPYIARKTSWAYGLVLAVGVFAFIPVAPVKFFYYAPLFAMGMLVYQYKFDYINRYLLWVGLAFLTGTSFLATTVADALWGLGSALVLVYVPLSGKPLLFLGRISYSLYITHLFVAYAGEMIVKRVLPIHGNTVANLALLTLYIGIAICFAYFFCRFVEDPFIRLAQRLKPKKKAI